VTGSLGKKPSVSDPSLQLGPADLHLWLCRRGGMAADSDRFRRELLSRYAPISPADWRFRLGVNGKPALLNPPRALQFNLSDSGEWLACAITATAAIGIDLEYCDPQREVMKLARRFFQAHELAALQACAESQRSGRFYDYWTLKEARIKSTGGSLGRELEVTGFGLSFPARGTGPGTISAAPRPATAFEYYCLLEPAPDYRLALCCHGAVGFSPRLRVMELLPAGDARVLSLPLRAVGHTTASKGKILKYRRQLSC
jgi:4'-phosphopantetheinyl transferase